MGTRQGGTVAILGPGRLGQAMGKLLFQAGVPVRFVAARHLGRARNAVRYIGGGKALRLGDHRLADADIILMTASDAALASLARKIAEYRKDWSGRIVLHTCGSLPSSVLGPFKVRRASIGSVHPYQTIPNPPSGVRNLPGGFWGVEGDAKALAVARKWVKVLSGTAFDLLPEAKPLYHLSAFLVCPTVVALMDCSERLLRQAGVPKEAVRPMLARFVSETVNNYAEFGAGKSLTGPAVRGDWSTVEKHVAQLQRFAPEMIPAYIELLNLMLRVSGASRGGSKQVRSAVSAGIRTAAR